MREFFYLLKWEPDLNIKDIISALNNINYFPAKLKCPACSGDMVMHKDSSRKDSFRWVCKNCRKRRPIRINTWAEKYTVSLTQLYSLIRYYVEGYNTEVVITRLGLDDEIVNYIFYELDYLRPVFIDKIMEVIECEIQDPKIKENLFRKNKTFSEISTVLSLPRVYEIVLKSLNENYLSNKENYDKM